MKLRAATWILPHSTKLDIEHLAATFQRWHTPDAQLTLVTWLPNPTWSQGWQALEAALSAQEQALAQLEQHLAPHIKLQWSVCWLADLHQELQATAASAPIVLYDPSAHPDALSWVERWLDEHIVVFLLKPQAQPKGQLTMPLTSLQDARYVPAIKRLRELLDGQLKLKLVELSVISEDPERAKAPQSVQDQAAKQTRQLLGWHEHLQLERVKVGLLELIEHHPATGTLTLATFDDERLTRAGLLRLLFAAQTETSAALIIPINSASPALNPTLDVCDVLPSMMGMTAQLRYSDSAQPARDLSVRLLHQGRLLAPIQTDSLGKLALPDASPGDVFGIISAATTAPTLTPEVIFKVVRAHAKPGRLVGLFDAANPPLWLDGAERTPDQGVWWAIRLDPKVSAVALNAALERWPVDALLDASDLLNDGQPTDLPLDSAPLRLMRVAQWLRAAGVNVVQVANPHPQPHETRLRWIADQESSPAPPWPTPTPAPPAPARSLADRLERLAGAQPTRARQPQVYWDSLKFRQRLIALIAQAQETIDLQMYIVEDDAQTHAVITALKDAAARGVEVNILIDSLYSRHGSMGLTNPALAALEGLPNITITLYKPVVLGAQWRDLKCRNHRKLIIFDGERAIISGRNLGWAYMTGFSEVSLNEQTPYHEVPWIDASIELSGPAAQAIEAHFISQWNSSAATPRAPQQAKLWPAADDVPSWLITHDSMSDVNGLEAYRALIDSAHAHIVVVNTFPLQFELQHALLGALERGVRVDYLVGNVRPLFGPQAKPFQGFSQLRGLITEVIHGRLDDLAQAGANVFMATLRDPAWPEALNPVMPHVHAKVMIVDGRYSAIGSANLDITASYWESEAFMILDSPALAATSLEQLIPWMSPEGKLDLSQPQWLARAQQRRWLAQNWPSFVG